VNAVLFAPVTYHYWQQKELKDGTYDYLDWLDMIEIINVDNENKRRDYEYRRRLNG